MSNAGVAAVVIAGASVLAMLAIAILGGVIKLVTQVSAMTTDLGNLRAEVAGQKESSDRAHESIYATIRDDRAASNKRFTRLEAAHMTARPDPAAGRAGGDHG